jgi:rod shape-determining protein MreD
MMIKTVVWTAVFSLIAAVLQSTLLSHFALYRAVPDIALGVLVFSAYRNGAMTGQVAGFFSGFLLDFLSAAPLGLNALVRTIIGTLSGLMKGTFSDVFFLPPLLCAAATLVKAACLFILHLLFPGSIPSYSLSSPVLWVELGLNTLCAPFLFALLKRFAPLFTAGRKS